MIERQLEGQRKLLDCTLCQGKQDHSMENVILAKCPKFLFLCLSRYFYIEEDIFKIENSVHIPEYLELFFGYVY